MELKNVLAVIVGLFIVLVSMSLFSDEDLFTGNAAVTTTPTSILKGGDVKFTISNALHGVYKTAFIIPGGDSCSSSDHLISLTLCRVDKCRTPLTATANTGTLSKGKSYKLSYKEYTSTGTLKQSCSGSFDVK